MTLRSSVASPIPPTDNGPKYTPDQSQDANLALMELEKGLRSNQCGEQCEAIVHVPALLDKYPFPLLVNSALLKLSDTFRSGSNFMKLCVLKAIQSSKRHLMKIFNVDEFCRRFFVVIHSNDPIARAVTLRVFGNIASIASERKNIHHCIRNSLDSHDTVEREAAIFALCCYAEQSSSFAESIWLKVADTIQNLLTPVDVKLKLLPVFRYMYHDFKISTQVFTLCEKLLKVYPTHGFVITILNTTSKLTLSTLVDVPKQIDTLLLYLREDPRKAINLCAIRNLNLLATKTSHLWTTEQVENLCSSAGICLQRNIKEKILSVINTLSGTPEAGTLFSEEALNYLETFSSDLSVNVSSLALQTRVNVAMQAPDGIDEFTIVTLETDLHMVLAISISEEMEEAYIRCLSTLAKLISLPNIDLSSTKFFLLECLTSLKDKYLLGLCRVLVTSRNFANMFENDIDTFLDILKDLSSSEDEEKDLIGCLITLILQILFVVIDNERKLLLEEKLKRIILDSHMKYQYWDLYKIARKASFMGCPNLSADLFQQVHSKVSSEQYSFWLDALIKFQTAESLIISCNPKSVDGLVKVLSNARNLYQDGLTNIKAAVTTNHPLYFQFKFAYLRSDMLKAYSQLITCCSMVKLCAPPQMVFQGTNGKIPNDIQYSGRIASQFQFQNCAALFATAAGGYQHLLKSSFNADSSTLQLLQLLQESAQLMTSSIDVLILNRNSDSFNGNNKEFHDSCVDENFDQYQNKLSETNIELYNHIKSIKLDQRKELLSQNHIDCISSVVLSQLKVGFSYPLYFYTTKQNTTVQLSITPGNSVKEHPFIVNVSHNMSLHIEGVIKQNYSNEPFRNIAKVNLRVKVVPESNVKNPSNVFKPVIPSEIILYESTEPRNDYFDVPFLIKFKYLGKHMIKISTGVTDQHGMDWETGPSYLLYADVIEHVSHVKRK